MIEKRIQVFGRVFMAAALLCLLLAAPAQAFDPQPANPASGPMLIGFTPGQVLAGSESFTLAVEGTGFVEDSVVRWNGADLATTFISDAHLEAAVDASRVTHAAVVPITVFNPGPGGGESASMLFSIDNPLPALTTLDPEGVLFGSSAFTLAVTGTGFVDTSVIRWDGADLDTTYLSATSLQAEVLAGQVALAGLVAITVFDPTPGGGESDPTYFGVNNPAPTLVSIDPTDAPAGSSPIALHVYGTHFIQGSTIRWDGEDLATTLVSPTELTSSISASRLALGDAVLVTVNNSLPGGGDTDPATFNINNPAPGVTGLDPNPVIAGNFGFTLTVTGSNFVSSSRVAWEGVELTTNYVSSTKLTAEIQDGWISAAGHVNISVHNPAPGGGTSGGSDLEIDNPLPVLSSLDPFVIHVNSPDFLITLTGGGFMSTSVVRWNGVNLATNYIIATELTAIVPASLLQTAGSVEVTVYTPGPGGGESSVASFLVASFQIYAPVTRR